MKPTFAKITQNLSKMVQQLEDLAEREVGSAVEKKERAKDLKEQATAHDTEADRAMAVATKLNELLSA